MSLTGNLSTMSLAEIFQWLNSGTKTGTLRLESKTGLIKDVYFDNGTINSASSSDPRELIGQYLLNCNKINEKQLVHALERQRRDHVLLGKILVQEGILNQEELSEILCTISEEIIYDLFLWKEGKFEFYDGILPERELPNMNLDITHIVLEGARREDEWLQIKDAFPDDATVILPNVEKIAENLPLTPENANILKYIDGSRSLLELTRFVRTTKFNVCRQLLDLYEHGMIAIGDFGGQQFNPPNQSNDPFQNTFTEIENYLKKGEIENAEHTLRKLSKRMPDNENIAKLKQLVEDKKLETTAKRVINPNAVPALSMDVNKITRLNLSPEEGFIISRVNGVFDVKSIIKISPFDEPLCLKIFKQFMDDGVISFK